MNHPTSHTANVRRAAIALLALLFTAGVASAQPADVNVSSGLTLAGAPLALHGYDPVAYFTAGEPRPGKAEHTAVHGGAAYRFASAANLERFEKQPARYLPQYGGFCAYGVSVGAKFDGDPEVWKIVDGRLYLNLNRKIQQTWEEDVPGAIGKADAQWPRIRAEAPADLG